MIEKLRNFLFRIFKKDSFIGKIADKVVTREIITYLFFGVCTTAVNFTIYTVLIRNMPGRVTLCNSIAWVAAILFAFVTNKHFVFESKSLAPGVLFKEFFTFVAARILTGLMEMFLPTLLIKAGLDMRIFGVEGMAAKIIVGIAIIILNYVFSKLIIFRKKNSRGEEIPAEESSESSAESPEDENAEQ